MTLKETFVRRARRVEGRAVAFNIDVVRLPNRKKATREYLDHPGAVGVIPIIDGNKVVMVSQYRHPVREITWELPAGKLAKGEDPLLCVKRELQEETGYTAGRIHKLLAFWPTAAFATEVIHLYVADKLKPGATNPDDDEFLRTEIWPLKKAYAAIKSGKIKDSKTIIGLLAYQAWEGR